MANESSSWSCLCFTQPCANNMALLTSTHSETFTRMLKPINTNMYSEPFHTSSCSFSAPLNYLPSSIKKNTPSVTLNRNHLLELEITIPQNTSTEEQAPLPLWQHKPIHKTKTNLHLRAAMSSPLLSDKRKSAMYVAQVLHLDSVSMYFLCEFNPS